MRPVFIGVSAASILLAACVGTPHKEPSQINAPEVAIYRLGLETGCKDAGRKKGDSQTKVEAFCSCMMVTFENRMTPGEWKQATFFAQQRRDRDEQAVLAPHLPFVRACRP
jgi:hypothetical protein